MTLTTPTTFNTYNKQGQELEDLVDGLLKAHGKPYRRNEVGADGDLTAQHRGDFQIGRNLYLECKNDRMFSQTGNLYLEIAEIRSADSPKDARTIQPIGVLKHASKAPTVMIHQVGEDDFIVYSARAVVSAMMQGDRELRWNEREDWKAGRSDKTNVGMLWMKANSTSSKLLYPVFKRTYAEKLLQTVELAAYQERILEPWGTSTIVDLAVAYGRKDAWKANGWSRYGMLNH